ncbi:MAG TPA: phosphopantetheine-binding protein, partial [Burkholderiales bacterium]|nr:phosphopantetheine-binding protein [Burkholderiales bacterium]
MDRSTEPTEQEGDAGGGVSRGLHGPRERLAEIWSELFGGVRVGPDESFFELGGHSLLAMQLLSRVRQTFGVELPLAALFAEPTLSGLAARIARAEPAPAAAAPPETAPDGPRPLSFSQRRVWFLAQLAPESVAYHTQLTLCWTGQLDRRALHAALAEIVRRHEILRSSFFEVDGEPAMRAEPFRGVDLPLVDLTALPP